MAYGSHYGQCRTAGQLRNVAVANYGDASRASLRRVAAHVWAAYTNTCDPALRREFFRLIAMIRHAV